MPTTDFDSANRAVRSGQLAKLVLGYEESARIVMLEKPTFVWVHQLKAPKIVDGEARMVNKQSKRKGATGEAETYATYDMDFIGRPACLGDYGVIKDKGLDEANCPACKRATESDQVKAPQRRFAVNVIRYALGAGGKLVTPFSCTCVVWAFNEATYDRLISLAEEYQNSGGLLGRDLRLGPCTSKEFQNFEITPGDQPVWKANPEITTRVKETFTENKVSQKDLEADCGRAVSARWMVDDLDRIAARWRVVDGAGSDVSDAVTGVVDDRSLTDGLEELLATATASPVAPTSAAPAAVVAAAPAEFDLSGLSDLLDTAPATDTAPPAPASDVLDFDELIKLGT